MRKSFTHPMMALAKRLSCVSTLLLFVTLVTPTVVSAQLFAPEFCVEVVGGKCRLLFTFAPGYMHSIDCGAPDTLAAGSDEIFYASLTHFEVSDLASTMSEVAYDLANPGECSTIGDLTKLQYHPTMPNTVITAVGTGFCTLGYYDDLLVTIENDQGDLITTELINKNPLPVEWVSFTGQIETDRSVLLEWKVASQINNSHFEVQHSADGRNYRNIHLERGDGTFAEERTFSYTHRSPKYGPNYYRIRQVDFDGTIDFSEIVVVTLPNKRVANIFPSILSGTELRVELETEKDISTIPIRITDVNGNLLYQEQAEVTKGITLHRVQLPKLPSGIYVLYVKTDGGHTEAHRFIRLEE